MKRKSDMGAKLISIAAVVTTTILAICHMKGGDKK